MASPKRLCTSISAHSWNKDCSMLALCPNTEEVWIYSNCQNPDPKKWKKDFVLRQHDLVVSGIDWSPKSNAIVTCSHDRNAFVWTFQDGEWKPGLTILRISRAALQVRWNPNGDKFAVASGAKCIPVCYYEDSEKWWISKTIKRHKSTVLDVAWHPNGQLLVTGCCDFKCRICSAFIDEVDEEWVARAAPLTPICRPDAGPFEELPAFGQVLAEFDCKGWVEAVQWCPSGQSLCFAGHDSSLTFVTFPLDGDAPEQQIVRFDQLPVLTVQFLGKDHLVAAGHDFNPLLFKANRDGVWGFVQLLDSKEPETKKSNSSFGAARAMFASRTNQGQSSKSAKTSLTTKHEGLIVDLAPTSIGGAVTSFSTAGTDGRVVMWDLGKLSGLQIKMSELRL